MLNALNFRLILFSLFLLVSTHAGAQSDKEKAFQQVRDLKEGVLLVKLYTNANKIKALQDRGHKESAERVKRETDSVNQVFVDQMKLHYSFSQVYYFYTDHLEEVTSGDYANLLNDELNPIESEFNYPKDQVFILDSKYVFFESMQTDQFGISVLDYKNDLLERPFPYYVRKRAALFFLKRDEGKMIRKLQEALEEFHEDALEE